MLKVPKSPELKVERRYQDCDSTVWEDGREVLKGEDWRQRKWELQKRSRGRCEMFTVLGKPHASFCYGDGQEPHHIVRRSKLRDDRLENLANLSHACHQAVDPRKVKWSKHA